MQPQRPVMRPSSSTRPANASATATVNSSTASPKLCDCAPCPYGRPMPAAVFGGIPFEATDGPAPAGHSVTYGRRSQRPPVSEISLKCCSFTDKRAAGIPVPPLLSLSHNYEKL